MFQWFRRSPIFLSRKVSLEQLEERIVLDAAGAAAPQDNPDQQGNQTNSSVQDETTASAAASPSSPESGGGASQPSDPVTQVFQQDLNVVLISNAMDQVEALTDAVVDGAEVIVFAAEGGLSAAVDQLASLVSSRGEKIDHLAILSHGAPGIVEVGPGHLIDPFCVIFDPAPWKELGMLLDGGARIDLYGCNIGQGPMGLFLVQAFAQVTEAAVWASDDATGNVEGADWELEVRSTDWDAGYLIVPDTLEPNAVLLAWSPNPPAGTPNADSFWNSAGGDPAIPVYGSVYTGAGDDYVQNDGSIQGDIWFGPDNDKLSNVGSYYPFGPKAMINGTVYGEDGDDEINNGNANKNCYPTIVSVYGGAGNDIIKNYGYIRHIYEDGGDDVITNYNYDPSGTVTFQSTVEYDIHGGPGNDVITNQAKSLVNGSIYGDGGVDTITNTWIVKGSIDGGTEADVLTNSGDLHGNLLGSYGNDTITNNWKVFTNIYGGEGNDIISNTKEVQFIFGDDSGSYTYCDDVITNTDTVWGAIYGQDGNDTITNNGYVSNDMSGHDGNDTIVNNWSVKWIDGGRGNDTISNTMSVYGSVYGGMGHDVITNISYVQGAIEGGEDSDTIYAGTAANPGGAIGAGINCGTGQDHVHVYSPNLGAYSGGVHIWGGEETDPYSLAWDQLNLYASVITIYGTANEGMSDWSAGGTTYHPIWAQFEQVNVHGTSGAFDFLLFGSDTYWHMLGNGASGSTGKYGTSERVNWDGYEYPIVFNSQPVLDSNPIMMPGTYMEDSGATSYMTLNQLMHLGGVNHVTDPDRLSTEFHVEGIAITGVNDDYGTWQYKDNFGSWQTVTGVSDSHALLLSSMSGLNDTEIRFLPNANWNGTLTDGLTFRAWDQVYETTQSFVDINAAGSWTNSFSATANTIGVTVQPVNDAPEVSTPFADVTVNEDASPVTINLLGHFSDVETASANLTYTASVVYAGGLSGSYVVDNAPDLLTFDFGANGHGSAHVTVTATDTGDGSDTTLLSVSDTFQVTVNPVNDAPLHAL